MRSQTMDTDLGFQVYVDDSFAGLACMIIQVMKVHALIISVDDSKNEFIEILR
jgi:hypothetical protein